MKRALYDSLLIGAINNRAAIYFRLEKDEFKIPATKRARAVFIFKRG
jgi:hypothetical protein